MATKKPIILTIPPVQAPEPELPQGEDMQLQRYLIPLDGKWIPAEDPSQIGKNFQSLKNLRYKEKNVEGILGMTKINRSAITTYKKVRSAMHTKIVDSAENHLLMQARNAGDTESCVIDFTTAPPTAAGVTDTPLWTDGSATAEGYFSTAPGGNVVYANGDDVCIWGGSEAFCSAMLTSSASVLHTATNPRDYSSVINNDSTDGSNSAILGGGIDSYVKLMMHFNGTDAATTYTDSSDSGKTVENIAGTDTCIDTAQAKFGTSSLYVAGGAYTKNGLTTADSADWDMGTGNVTIDMWVRPNTIANAVGLLEQYASSTAYVCLQITSGKYLKFDIVNTSTLVTMTASTQITEGEWSHVVVQRSGSAWKIVLNGVSVATATASITWPNLAAALTIGSSYKAGYALDGWIDELRISKGIARWPSTVSVPTTEYMLSSLYFLVGSLRPLQGIKAYVTVGNAAAGAT